jgi:hypothetical protein
MKNLFISLFILIFISIAYTEEDTEIIRTTQYHQSNLFPLGYGTAGRLAKEHITPNNIINFYSQNNINTEDYVIIIFVVYPNSYGCCDDSCTEQCMTYSSITQGHKWGIFFVAYKGYKNTIGGFDGECASTNFTIKIKYLGDCDGFKCYIREECHN